MPPLPPHEQPVPQPIRPQLPLVSYPSSRSEPSGRSIEDDSSAAAQINSGMTPSAHHDSQAVVTQPDAEPSAPQEQDDDRSWTSLQPIQETHDDHHPNETAVAEPPNGRLADQTESFSAFHGSAAVLAPQTSVSQPSSADLALPSSPFDQRNQSDLLGRSMKPTEEARYDPASSDPDDEEESQVPDPAPTGSPCARAVRRKRKWTVRPERIQQRQPDAY